MADKLKFYLGYDESKNIRAINAQSLLIGGKRGSGKSIFLNNFIYNLLLHNSRDILRVKFYTEKYGAYNLTFNNERKSLPLIEFVNDPDLKKDNDFIDDAYYIYESRENTIRLAGVPDIHEYNKLNPSKAMQEVVYIVDGLINPIKIASPHSSRLATMLREGARYGIYLVIVNSDEDKLNSMMIDEFPGKVVLACEESMSFMMLDSDLASTQAIAENRLAIYKDNVPHHSPIYFRTPLLTKEKMKLALDVFYQL